MLNSFISDNLLGDNFKTKAKNSYIPLAEKIVSQVDASTTPYFVGVNGCQGSGKSTLCDFLAKYIAHQYQLKVVVLSLDDFYLSQKARNELALDVHPLLSTRGVPGTHDTAHIAEVFDLFKQNKNPILLPRFSKADDNPYPKSAWQEINSTVDIVLFEGWCWGVTPQEPSELLTPVNQLEKEQDASGKWRRYVNQQLGENYQPLYQTMNFWILLKAPSFDSVFNWRLEQEDKLRMKTAAADRTSIMSGKEVAEFIKYYQRLTEHCFTTMAKEVDVLFELDNNRQITSNLTL